MVTIAEVANVAIGTHLSDHNSTVLAGGVTAGVKFLRFLISCLVLYTFFY